MKTQALRNVMVVIGAGPISQAIARRVSAGKHVLLADLHQENADTAAKTLSEAGFNVTTAKVDVSSRASVQALVKNATSLGEASGVIHAAGGFPFSSVTGSGLEGAPKGCVCLNCDFFVPRGTRFVSEAFSQPRRTRPRLKSYDTPRLYVYTNVG